MVRFASCRSMFSETCHLNEMWSLGFSTEQARWITQVPFSKIWVWLETFKFLSRSVCREKAQIKDKWPGSAPCEKYPFPQCFCIPLDTLLYVMVSIFCKKLCLCYLIDGIKVWNDQMTRDTSMRQSGQCEKQEGKDQSCHQVVGDLGLLILLFWASVYSSGSF